jgi:hypothetical protein
MKLVHEKKKKKQEKLARLGSLKPGQGWAFRRQGVTYEEALSGTNDACFFIPIKMTPEKTGRVAVVSLDGASGVIEMDDSHLVHAHRILEIEISKPALE